MKERRVHDNRILSYEVDADDRRIVLRTRYEDQGEPFEVTDIIFDGVFAYHFENDNFHTIIFDVDEEPITCLVDKWKSLFEHGLRYGWPDPSIQSVEGIISHCDAHNLNAFHIEPSCGLYGWVIAESCQFKEVSGERAD